MINRVTLLGRIGKKDYKTTKNGIALCTLSIATHKRYIDGHGQKKQITNWHMVYFFDKLSEITNKYAMVGNLVYVEGEINNRTIQEDGKNKILNLITANKIEFIPTGSKEVTASSDNQTKEPSNEKAYEEPRLYSYDDDDSIDF
jgi:single-strand DNA-binding protein